MTKGIMEFNKIYNEDCFLTMDRMQTKVDVVLTSPPYNMTKRKGGISDTGRYDCYIDWKTETDYIQYIAKVFKKFETVLNDKGVVLLNLSYSIENPSLPYKTVCGILEQTNFKLIDTIVWKKKNGLPFPANKQRLSRIFENIYVFALCDDFHINRKIKSTSAKTGQNYYEIIYNFIEARNNDEVCPYNQATFSSELCEKLLNIYAKEDALVYDPFIGSGTTAVACKKMGLNYIGSEISEKQCAWAMNRLEKTEKERGE